jgi:uncharacterized protein (TIGR03000 family)
MFKTDWLGVKVAVLAASVVLMSAGESQACWGRGWGYGGYYGGWGGGYYDYGCYPSYYGGYGGWGYPGYYSYSYPSYSYPTYAYSYPSYNYPDLVIQSQDSSYLTATATNQPAARSANGTQAPKDALIEVTCPANAKIFFGDSPTMQTGSQRKFLSPELAAGKTYTYEVRATWTDANNKAVTQTRQVQVQAGKRSTVNFLQ